MTQPVLGNYLWPCTEFPHKLCENNRDHIACFIEEDAYTRGFRDNTTTVCCGEFDADFVSGG